MGFISRVYPLDGFISINVPFHPNQKMSQNVTSSQFVFLPSPRGCCWLQAIYNQQSMHVKSRRQVALPSIPTRPLPDPDKPTPKPTSDRFDRYFRPELEKQELIRREMENYERTHHPHQKAPAGRGVAASREGGTLVEHRQTKSTPKLEPNRQSAKKKSIRELQERYSQNERLSHELCLPREVNLSRDSSEDGLRDALVRDDGHRLAEPTIYVLSRNPQHNLIKPKPRQLFSTEAGEQLQVRELEQQPVAQLSVMPRMAPLFPSAKEEKYIRQKLVGQQAIAKFYSRYRNIDKLREMEEFKLQFNPITAILTILEHYNIPPKRMELIKLRGQEALLDLRNCGLGSGVSIKAVAEIVEKVRVFEEIDLSYNNIHADLCEVIIPHLAKMRRINLAYNKIGRHGVELLGRTVGEGDGQLEELSLEGNGISDSAMGGLFGALGKGNSLVILNLSKNWLGNFAAARLKEYIKQDTDLTELYLHWCELGTRATRLIFEGLRQNYCLRVLDVSWNQIGLESIAPLCHFLKTNDTLVHLDVSFCEIDETDTRKIAKALKHNRTLYGIHYQGNLGYIDHKGYLHAVKKQHKQTPLSIRAGLIQRINSVSIVKDTHAANYEPLHRSICWICQGWEERYFKVPKQPTDEHCFMHFDFEAYQGVLMNDMGTHHEILRMCPPREVRYFHSRLSKQGQLTHAVAQDSRSPLAHPLPDFLIDHHKVSAQLLETNLSPQPQYYTQIFNEDYLTKLHCQPRTDDLRPNAQLVAAIQLQSDPPHGKPKRRRRKRPQPQLVKEIQVKELPSEFDNLFNRKAGEGEDREGLIKQCVDFDIAHSRVGKLLQGGQLGEVRAVLEQHYLLFQKIYYFLANNNPNAQGVYSISENRFQKFVEEQSYESKRVTKAKIRLKLVSCLAQRSDAEVQGFYRPQFFEFLLRVAMEKWCHAIPKKEGQTEYERKKREKYPLSPREAFERMLRSLKKYEEKADSEGWRQTHLCTYEVNTVLKSYAPFLERVYEKYAGLTQKNLNPRMKKKLLLEEYRILCLTAELRKTREGLKDLEVHYRTAKRLEVEDGIADSGQDYLEFLETFCRLADGLALRPIGQEAHPVWDTENTIERVPLFLKIEKLLKEVYLKNYDLRNKKFDQLFQLGLFPQEISVLVEYLKAQAQLNNSQSMRRTVSLRNIQLNSLLGQAGSTITLGFLIELLKRKAEEVQRENKMRLQEVGEESDSGREDDGEET